MCRSASARPRLARCDRGRWPRRLRLAVSHRGNAPEGFELPGERAEVIIRQIDEVPKPMGAVIDVPSEHVGP